ncbi:MAG: adenylate/guanylate cyclase domain-containing protein, partial [Pseudomonadota bacterium]
KEKPLVSPESFKNKIVFIGAKAAALYDLRSTPLDKSLPGVEIHAAFLNSLMARDFLRQGSLFWRALLPALLFLCTLSAALLTRSALTGAFLSLALAVLYVLGVVYGFRHNVWLDLVSPVLGQGMVFILASLINYYGEGREKSAVRSAFSRYLSPAVVSDVLENPQMLSLGGSRRVMTCFFSDLAGFTTISEGLSPEDLVHLLNRYLSLMTKAIMDSGGTVDKYEGDAIMAFWGAPLIQEDHALRASLSALEQQKIVAAFRAEVMAEGLPEIRVRMGLNTGPMIVGNMGSEERFDYTVMGDSVNLASRLEGANKQYGTEIMISESTYQEVEGQVEVRELDLLRVKGKKEPIRVFELVAEKGGTPAKKAEVIARYNQGLSLYRDMDFSAAERSFLQALEIDPEDGPSKTYIERCRAYQQQPPPVDWDRVFTMTSK